MVLKLVLRITVHAIVTSLFSLQLTKTAHFSQKSILPFLYYVSEVMLVFFCLSLVFLHSVFKSLVNDLRAGKTHSSVMLKMVQLRIHHVQTSFELLQAIFLYRHADACSFLKNPNIHTVFSPALLLLPLFLFTFSQLSAAHHIKKNHNVESVCVCIGSIRQH